MTRDRRLQEFAARHGFGLVGVAWFPGGERGRNEEFAWNYCDPWDVVRLTRSVKELEEQFGVVIDHVTLAPDRRALECLMPWRFVGTGGPMEEPPVGTRLALVLGYNDADGDEAAGCSLRWPHGIDPWSRAGGSDERPRPWGNILIAPALAE